MHGSNPSLQVVLAITSDTAFLELGGVANLVRAASVLEGAVHSHSILVAVTDEEAHRVDQFLQVAAIKYDLLICEPTVPQSLAQALSPKFRDVEAIMIHDASRPLTPKSQFGAVIAAFDDGVDAVRPAVAFTETLKIVDKDSVIVETLDRSSVLRIGTPELIRVSAIEVDGQDSGWFLPLKKDARILHLEGSPEGTRINSSADRDLMELPQD